jgi:hypothetical protein
VTLSKRKGGKSKLLGQELPVLTGMSERLLWKWPGHRQGGGIEGIATAPQYQEQRIVLGKNEGGVALPPHDHSLSPCPPQL